jgi:glycosyltransferase 2 family protein
LADPQPDARRRRLRRALLWSGVAITAALVAVAVVAVDPAEVWEAMRGSDMRWLVPALGVLALSVVLRAVRWRTLFVAGTAPPLGEVTRALLIGLFFNNVLPLRAGEAARLVALHARAGGSRTQIAGTIAIERVYDVAALLVLLAVSLPWLPDVTWLRAAAWLGAGLAAALVIAVLLLLRFGERGLRLLLWPMRWLPFMSVERWEHAPRNLARGLAGITEPRVAVVVFAWTAVSWIVLGASAWLLMLGFGLDLPPLAGLLVIIAVGLAMVIPSPPAAVGVFEAATVVALAAYGVAAAPALSYGLVLHALNFVPYIVAGLAVLGLGTVARRRGALE